MKQEKLLIPNPLYSGKYTCCHTQAILTAFFPQYQKEDQWIFECLTTVPFGIIHVPNDPNRIIDSYFDPDIGLDRALDTLEAIYEVRYWSLNSDGYEAWNELENWLTSGPVVLGPLNMGKLPYYFHNELYTNIDHYIVALEVDSKKITLCDPEGYIVLWLSREELLNAWKGGGVREGRGEFVMRRILEVAPLNIDFPKLLRTFMFGTQNLISAQRSQPDGISILHFIAQNSQRFMNNSSIKRGLTFGIPTRIQRCILIQSFIKILIHEIKDPQIRKRLSHIYHLLERQVELFGIVLMNVLEKEPEALSRLNTIGVLEDELTNLFDEVGKLL